MARQTDNLNNKRKAESSAPKPFKRAPIVGIDIPAEEPAPSPVSSEVEEKVEKKAKEVEEKTAPEEKVREVEKPKKERPVKAPAKTPVKKAPAAKQDMTSKQKKNMVVKFVFGIVVLIIFVIFAYISISVAPHTSDVPDTYETAENLHRGVEREKDVVETPVPTEVVEAVVVEETVATPEAVEETPEVVRPEVLKAQELGLPEPPEIDTSSWEYLLVNSTHTIGEDFRPETFAALSITMDDTDIEENTDGVSSDRCLVDYRIGEALRDFALACKEAGNPVYLSSGYRSYADQNYLYQRKVSQGYSEDEAKTIVAYPGTSEHQTGLCCDITDYYRETKDSSLENTDTYKWLVENCADYGFVVRYPEDKSGSADSITGIIFEPWHFRYVGVEAAKYMTENNLCLEEFLALYE